MKNMKKAIAFGVALVMAGSVALTGCGSAETQQPEPVVDTEIPAVEDYLIPPTGEMEEIEPFTELISDATEYTHDGFTYAIPSYYETDEVDVGSGYQYTCEFSEEEVAIMQFIPVGHVFDGEIDEDEANEYADALFEGMLQVIDSPTDITTTEMSNDDFIIYKKTATTPIAEGIDMAINMYFITGRNTGDVAAMMCGKTTNIVDDLLGDADIVVSHIHQ